MSRALVVGFALLLSLPGTAHADGRALWLRHAHTGQVLHLRPFGRAGRLTPRAAAMLTRFLRGGAASARIRIYPRTVGHLAHLQRQLGGSPLEVYSAFRGDGDPRGGEGYHTLGRAVDFKVKGIAPRHIFTLCRRFARAGCGLYPNEHFVHVDARPYRAFWVDLSTGRGNRYVKDADAWLRAHPTAGGAP